MKKKVPVKLDDLINEIDIQMDETFTYINTHTGEVITLTREEIRAAEDEELLEKYPDWQRENIEKAIKKRIREHKVEKQWYEFKEKKLRN
jgi:asparagine synthetase A